MVSVVQGGGGDGWRGEWYMKKKNSLTNFLTTTKMLEFIDGNFFLQFKL